MIFSVAPSPNIYCLFGLVAALKTSTVSGALPKLKYESAGCPECTSLIAIASACFAAAVLTLLCACICKKDEEEEKRKLYGGTILCAAIGVVLISLSIIFPKSAEAVNESLEGLEPAPTPAFRPTAIAQARPPVSIGGAPRPQDPVFPRPPTSPPKFNCFGDKPNDWQNSRGDTCRWFWYDPEPRCSEAGGSFANMGFTANEVCCECGAACNACCVCGGVQCRDSPSGWHDANGNDCTWYAQGNRCEEYGDMYAKFNSVANMVCCVCGSGQINFT